MRIEQVGGILRDAELSRNFPNSFFHLFREKTVLGVEYTLIVRDNHTRRITHRADITLKAGGTDNEIRTALLKNLKVMR